METGPKKSRNDKVCLSRRQALGAGVGAAGMIVGAPFVHARSKPTVRVLGTSVTLLEPIRKKAEQDLGIKLEFDVRSGVSAQQKAITQPQSYDIYDQWFNTLDLAWPSGSLAPINVNRISNWKHVNGLTKTGRIRDEAPIGQGDAPIRKIYVQNNGKLDERESNKVSMLPHVNNVDSFGYNADVIKRGTPYETESWAWLLDPAHRGRVALLNDPAIGFMDAALAVQARGDMAFENIGNMTRTEIDALVAILINEKKNGQFHTLWSSFTESVDLMGDGDVVVKSMWSPAVTALRGQGKNVIYASPKEGYRAWHGGMCLSSETFGAELDAAYDYMDWWLSGWPGAMMARQGYYSSAPGPVQTQLSAGEWAYWYEGDTASTDLTAPDGKVVVKAGEKRDGGSYEERVSRIAVWNSVMDEHVYLVRRWNEFLRA